MAKVRVAKVLKLLVMVLATKMKVVKVAKVVVASPTRSLRPNPPRLDFNSLSAELADT